MDRCDIIGTCNVGHIRRKAGRHQMDEDLLCGVSEVQRVLDYP